MDFRKKRHVVDFLFVIALLFLFAFSAIMLIALGADVYQKNVETMRTGYNRRTAGAYIAQKVRQADSVNGVSIEDMGDGEALVLKAWANGRSYSTWLYLRDGNLCEQMIRSDQAPIPDAGQRIIPLEGFGASFEAPGLLSVKLVLDGGERQDFFLNLMSEGLR